MPTHGGVPRGREMPGNPGANRKPRGPSSEAGGRAHGSTVEPEAAIAADILTRRWLPLLEPSQLARAGSATRGPVAPVASRAGARPRRSRRCMQHRERKKTTYSGGTVQDLD